MSVTAYGIATSAICQLALEMSPSGILVVEPGGRIVLVNRELEQQFGYAREELVGLPLEVLLPDSTRLVHAESRDTARSPEPSSPTGVRELVGRRKDGKEIAVEVGLNSIRAADGLLILASVVDMSGRRRLEKEHEEALEQQLEFERFVAELSGKFINLPVEEIPAAIRDGLRRISEQLGLDRSSILKIGPDGMLYDPVSWTAADVPTIETPLPGSGWFPWTLGRIRDGQVVSFSSLDEVPDETDRDSFRSIGTRSALYAPLSVAGQLRGAVAFATVHAERTWPPKVVHRLTMLASVFTQVLARTEREEAMQAAAAETQRLKELLLVENVYLRQEARERLGLTRVVGQSPSLRRVLEQIQQVAATDSTVLLLGETGTGKELFATQIHEQGGRHSRSMVRVNCAAIPATLIESELFGREKGAFTGALARQVGRFELADHSTIFLDEIGDLPLEVQVKLLRVLEERKIERLGSPRPIGVDVRIIAATHRNLEQRIAEGTFREDLYYRLNVFPIQVPPLRDRVDDIPLLVWRFVEEFSKAFAKRIDSIDKASLAALSQYTWPGNIRELRNVVERAMIVASSQRLSIPLPRTTGPATRRSPRLVDVEKDHIRTVLESTAWRIRGAGGAADRLGLKPTTLETRMAKLGLKRPSSS
jgi:formate hydrogenlyase transcriptional activator